MAIELNFNKELAPELGAPGLLGGSAVAELGICATIASSPVAVSLRTALAVSVGGALEFGMTDSEIQELYKRFNIWIIPHVVSIVRRSGVYEPTYVGVQVRYKTGDRTCSVRSLIPSPQFVQHGTFSAAISLQGEIGPTNALGTARTLAMGALGLNFGVDGKSRITATVQASVATPYISAVGVGSNGCEWRFDRHEEPLFGRDIHTWAVVALSKYEVELKYSMRFYVGVRRLIITKRFESKWKQIVCALPTD